MTYYSFVGYVDPREEIYYVPHESRVDGDKYGINRTDIIIF
jgi:hypothetical protein